MNELKIINVNNILPDSTWYVYGEGFLESREAVIEFYKSYVNNWLSTDSSIYYFIKNLENFIGLYDERDNKTPVLRSWMLFQGRWVDEHGKEISLKEAFDDLLTRGVLGVVILPTILAYVDDESNYITVAVYEPTKSLSIEQHKTLYRDKYDFFILVEKIRQLQSDAVEHMREYNVFVDGLSVNKDTKEKLRLHFRTVSSLLSLVEF